MRVFESGGKLPVSRELASSRAEVIIPNTLKQTDESKVSRTNALAFASRFRLKQNKLDPLSDCLA